jgi:Ni,Fe-hydrogenase I cytochrome b subunit
MVELSEQAGRRRSAGHARWVKLTHWIGTVSFLILAFTGIAILMVHPRLYWGEVGNDSSNYPSTATISTAVGRSATPSFRKPLRQ